MTDSRIGMTFHFTPAPQSRDDSQAPRGGLGSQVLPVAELGDDFAGDPEDGSQYLFLVRCAPRQCLRAGRELTHLVHHADERRRPTPRWSASRTPTRDPKLHLRLCKLHLRVGRASHGGRRLCATSRRPGR